MYIADATSVGNVFFTGTINITLITITVLSISLVVWSRWKDKAEEHTSAAVEGQSGTQAATTKETE
jgi:C4-dicarboxylate transporter